LSHDKSLVGFSFQVVRAYDLQVRSTQNEKGMRDSLFDLEPSTPIVVEIVH
jgi:hypothetical protein